MAIRAVRDKQLVGHREPIEGELAPAPLLQRITVLGSAGPLRLPMDERVPELDNVSDCSVWIPLVLIWRQPSQGEQPIKLSQNGSALHRVPNLLDRLSAADRLRLLAFDAESRCF